MYLWSLKDEQYLNSFDCKQCSVFLGSDSLLMDNKNLSYWVNQDQTGFYVFSRNQGVPEAQWTRATRSNPNPQVFEAVYAAKVSYAGDAVTSRKVKKGLYLDLGEGTSTQAH